MHHYLPFSHCHTSLSLPATLPASTVSPFQLPPLHTSTSPTFNPHSLISFLPSFLSPTSTSHILSVTLPHTDYHTTPLRPLPHYTNEFSTPTLTLHFTTYYIYLLNSLPQQSTLDYISYFSTSSSVTLHYTTTQMTFILFTLKSYLWPQLLWIINFGVNMSYFIIIISSFSKAQYTCWYKKWHINSLLYRICLLPDEVLPFN